MQEIYNGKLAKLNDRSEKEDKKLKTLERRRNLELEGYHQDLHAMKKKVSFYEKYINKLKTLVEEDQASLLDQLDIHSEDEEAEGYDDESRQHLSDVKEEDAQDYDDDEDH